MNFKFIFLVILTLVLGSIIPLIYRHQKILNINQSFVSSISLYQRNLPSDWLVGTVTDIGSSVQIETRYGTKFEDLTIGTTISLGEDIKTDFQDNSSVVINFPDLAKFNINSNTRLNFTNTNSDNFLISLNRGGNLDFEALSNSNQFSITSLHLLSQFIGATGNFTIDSDIITIKLTQGSVKLGYNDSDIKTQIVDVTGPKKIIFNDTKRTVKLKNL